MAQSIVLYPKRKERGLVKIAGNEINSVINQITNTTSVTSLDAVPDGLTYGRVLNTNLSSGRIATLTGNLAAGSYILTGLGAGAASGNSVRYEQLIGLYLLLTGGTMSGAIAMGSQKITGLAAGSEAGDAARYEQVLLLAGGTLSGAVNVQDLIPSTTNTYDLGSSSNEFTDGYIKNCYVDTTMVIPSEA